ncbi:MAG: transglutaminase family protein [Hamadaea sp.]|uniref:transglutaminase family protein n=1 Tax=Hamadaea sp. TaxID=2024425 RepID=UPI00184D929B|nr:transglutaminase family protein [Hamadaea sp.]NUR47750.1 transglutaminase family protein [Hamadaea sp.]NUR72286.1 transglutaminase family protein [Hamadaea sp.]NUT23242.1 transglutaminase family protein [Hamadaea sp.]
MGWRVRVEHHTGFEYAGPVVSSYNEARMVPGTDARQIVLQSSVAVRPSARTFQYHDYWGTLVTAFDVHVPHATLEVVAESVVETSSPAAVHADGPGWAEVNAPAITDRWAELLLSTPRTALDAELTETATELRRSHRTPDEAARAVCEMLRTEIEYVPGTTGVLTDAVQVWRQRQGVCQDISHLAIALLRAMGVPARYVSGYLHPTPNAALGERVVGQSHAWIEWWSGEWRSFDPTNGVPIGERHVLVGRGRDYGDVPPLKGVFAGAGGTGQQVAVTITRLR